MTPSVARRAFIEESPFVVDLLGGFRLPGVYAFKTDLTMAGRWLLSISARVQGEAEPIVGRVIFTARR